MRNTKYRNDAKAFLLLALVTGLVLWLYGCAGPAPRSGPTQPDSEFTANVYAALAEIERRGLGEWVEYGRGMVGSIGNSNQWEPLGMTFFVDGQGYIALRDEWEGLDVGEAGEMLLEELYHLRTRVLSHTPELAALLAAYWVGG